MEHIAMENYVFQYPSVVENFSSQYDGDDILYYGFTDQRTICKGLPPSQKPPIMPQNVGIIRSQEFIILSFETPIIPVVISLFQTNIPGSIVRISGKVIDLPERMTWKLLWEGSPQNCIDFRLSLFGSRLKQIKERVKEIYIEFDHSLENCYKGFSIHGILIYPENDGNTEIIRQTINRIGYIFDCDEPRTYPEPRLSISYENEKGNMVQDQIFKLPDETLMKIFSLLDFKSLRLCMRVCKRFNYICKNPYFYTELNLKLYWSVFSNSMLNSLEPYCCQLTKLDLSWCGITRSVLIAEFNAFLNKCGTHLTHLRLDSCGFVNGTTLFTINLFCKYLKELSLRSCSLIDIDAPPSLCFTEMEYIDFYKTKISNYCLASYLEHMPKLKHINLGSCPNLDSMDHIAYLLSKLNKQLVSVDFWKSYSLSPIGLRYLTVHKQLEEVDFGWCTNLESPGDILIKFVQSCPQLKKISIAYINRVFNHNIDFATYCSSLEQIYLTGLMITIDVCSKFLQECQNLISMDISFCGYINEVDVVELRLKYPNVRIQFII